jgi:hypothetical protein
VATPDPLHHLEERLAALGLAPRGRFQPEPGDGVPPLPDGTAAGTLVMVGSVGGTFWPHLQAAQEAKGPDPIDRWTERVLGEVAAGIGATALFPFGGPPHHPFQRWARRADPELATSPLGILIHPDHGLWHALRGALLLRQRLEPPAVEPRPSPCLSCATKPCLGACPVRAFTERGYDVRACRSYLATLSGQPCMIQGCQARLACPVGRGHAYRGAQAQHHMRAFARG